MADHRRRPAFLRGLVIAAALVSMLAGVPGGGVRSALADQCQLGPCWTLTVSLSGDGSGAWQSTDSNYNPGNNPNIDCHRDNGVQSGSCSFRYTDLGLGIKVFFLITTKPGTTLLSGLGVPQPTPVKSSLTLTSNDTAFADFELQERRLTLTVDAGGDVTVNDANCHGSCTYDYPYGTLVEMATTVDAGYRFLGWTGACTGSTPECALSMTADRTAHAGFARIATPAPSKATPKPTPRPTPRPTAVPITPRPATPVPVGSGAAPSGPVILSSDGDPSPPAAVDDSAALSSSDIAALPASLPPASEPGVPASPVAASQPDLTPVVLSIVVAALLISGGLVFAGLALRRRERP